MSKIWIGLSTTNIHLLQFEIQSHLQKCKTLNAGTSELTPKKKLSAISNITFHHFALLSYNTLNCNPQNLGIYSSWWNHQMCFKMVYSHLKIFHKIWSLCYLCTTHCSALSLSHPFLGRPAYLLQFLTKRKPQAIFEDDIFKKLSTQAML